MLLDLIFPQNAWALPKGQDFSFFELAEVRSDLWVFFVMIGAVLIYLAGVLVRDAIQKAMVQKNLHQYEKKKALTKMQTMNASDKTVKGMMTIAQDCNRPAEDLLADNQLFETCLLEFRNKYPGHPLLRKSQPMRVELGFVFSNPNAKFISTRMLEPMQEVRVFADMQGRHISFLTKVLRSSEKQLWLQPPKVKDKFFDISKFSELTLKVFRPNDGEFSVTLPLRAQVQRPVDALVLDQSDTLQRLDPDQMKPVNMEFENKFVFMVEQISEFTIFKKYDSFPCMASVLALSTGSLEIASEAFPRQAHEGCFVLFKLKQAGLEERITAKVYSLSTKKNVTYAKLQITKLSEKGRLALEKYINDQKRIKVH